MKLLDFLKLANDFDTPVTVRERIPGQKRSREVTSNDVGDLTLESDLKDRTVNGWEAAVNAGEPGLIVYIDREEKK